MADDLDLDLDDLDDLDGLTGNDADWTVALNCGPCHQCGRKYPGSDRSGGHCTMCHYSFASQSGFDAHLRHKGSNRLTCYTPDELTAKGWTLDDRGVYRMPPPKNQPKHWTTKKGTDK